MSSNELVSKQKTALDMATDAIHAYETFGHGVHLVSDLLLKMGLIAPGLNKFDELFDKINAELKKVLAATLNGFTLQTMRNIAEKVGTAKSSAQTATHYLNLGRPQNDFVVAGQMSNAATNSLDVINALIDPAFWKRTYNPLTDDTTIEKNEVDNSPFPGDDATIKDPHIAWMKHITGRIPVDDQGLVFDYRLALPAFLQVLAARLLVMDALDPAHRKNGTFASELMGYVHFLDTIWDKILTGIRFTPAISNDNDIIHHAISCGAVDVYSGASSIEANTFVVFEPGLWPDIYTNPPAGIEQLNMPFDLVKKMFVSRYIEHLKAHRRVVLRLTGVVRTFFTVIPTLETLAGVPVADQMQKFSLGLRAIGSEVIPGSQFIRLQTICKLQNTVGPPSLRVLQDSWVGDAFHAPL